MQSTYEARSGEQTEIKGRILQGRDIFVGPTKFAAVCKVLWPNEKLAPKLAELSKRDERTAKRWLAGEFEPPICVVLAVINAIFQR